MAILRTQNLTDPSITFGDPNNYNQPQTGGTVSSFQLISINKYRPKPLSAFTTDLTYLRYGKDAPGGGNSGQPYIVFPIPPPKLNPMNPSKVGARIAPVTPNITQYYWANRSSGDFPARGGGIAPDNTTQTTQIDRQRISTFLNSAKGKVFLQKQADLQLSNPAMETSTGFNTGGSFRNFINNIVSGTPVVLPNTRVYNPRSTITQVAVSGTGLHAIRHGNSLFNLDGNYADTVGLQMNLGANEAESVNRLLTLKNLKLNIAPTLGNISTIDQNGLSLNPFFIQNYSGGPNSSYGVGNTTIKRATDTSDGTQPSKVGSTNVMSYDIISRQNLNNTTNGERTTNIKAKDRAETYKLVRPLAGSKLFFDPDDIANGGMTANVSTDPWITKDVSNPDMINFGFECIDNDNPTQSDFLQFRAYLSNTITDNNQASLNSFKYLGRGEDFYTYQGFSRTIGFGFKLVQESGHVAAIKNSYDKLNILMSQVYPDYSVTNIMRAPLVRITIGNYYYRVPGFIDSINVTVDQEASWEIKKSYQLPYIINVDISFKPIMDNLPQKNSVGAIRSYLINNPTTKANT